MILNKKVVESSMVAAMLVIMTTTTSVTGHTLTGMSKGEMVQTTAMAESRDTGAVAGVIGQIGSAEEEAIAKEDVSIQQSDAQVVAAAGVVNAVAQDITGTEIPVGVQQTTAPDQSDASAAQAEVTTSDTQTSTETNVPDSVATAAETVETVQPAQSVVSNEVQISENTATAIQSDEVSIRLAQEQAEWNDRLMPSVNEYLNIRTAADENAEVVGKLYKGDAAQIVEKGDTWTHITSAAVEGYVLNDYCAFGIDAYNLAHQDCQTEATVMTGGLRLRSEPSEDATVIDAVYEGQVLTVSPDGQSNDGWVAVEYENQNAYVSAEYVDIKLSVGSAISVAEERAAEEAEAEKSNPTSTKKAAVSASADETTILGALIQLEAGSECYEGKVAVGAVVMNRVRSGSYPGSISGVVYQGGQFTTAASVAGVISSGVSSSCMQAAQEAIGGSDNTGGCVSFRRVSSGRNGVVIGNHVFF